MRLRRFLADHWFAVLFVLVSCYTIGRWIIPSRPDAVWDTSADALIVEIVPMLYFAEVSINDIPSVRIWGDGTVVWTDYDDQHGRLVFTGQLSEAAMQQVVERIVHSELATTSSLEQLSFPEGFPVISMHLDGRQITQAKEVWSPEQQAVLAFLQSGAGATPTPFVPTIGHLYVYTNAEAGYPGRKSATHHWPKDQFGYGLNEIHRQERTVTGEELLFLWEIVNESPHSPLIRSEGEVYWVGLSIPRVSRLSSP